jgi:hypothetical protein
VKAVGTSFSASLFDALYLFIVVNQREERGDAYEHKQVAGAKLSK